MALSSPYQPYQPLPNGFRAAANHCAFIMMNGTTVASFKKELADYDTSKGTIRFTPEKPLPQALIRKLVKARVAENVANTKPAIKMHANERNIADSSNQVFKPRATSQAVRFCGQ